jgi:TolA-binding protein
MDMLPSLRCLTGIVVLAGTPLLAQQLPAQETPVQRTASVVPAAAARDSAIRRLEAFLTRYPDSPLRPEALLQLGELLVNDADERFAETQRAAARATTDTSAPGSDAPARPDYAQAIRRYEELVTRYPTFGKMPAAAYTLGTLYMQNQRYADAARVFRMVTEADSSRFQGESYFRLGDAYFELAARESGTARREGFARAAQAYERATTATPAQGDIYFLSLYKLGWSYYNQATRSNEAAYQRAVETFGQLVEAYDKLTPDQQSRLGLRGEAIEYMAVAFTQVGGAEAANEYFATRGGSSVKLPILRRVAQSLRDQGDFPKAVEAYRAVIAEAPTDSASLSAQQEVIDIYQNRMIEPAQAQAARLELVEKFAPGSAWASANPGLAAQAATAREDALRQSGQYLLAQAQRGNNRAQFAEAANIYQRYLTEFANADSAQAVNLLYAEALFGQGEFMRAGAEYSRAAYGRSAPTPAAGATDTVNVAQRAGQNAIVAFDSAFVRDSTNQAVQDSLFTSVDRFVRAFPQTEQAKRALIQKGRRASQAKRWDVMAETFRTYASTYPNDPYTPTAQKLVGDALFRAGKYAEAQTQWESAANIARSAGRRALADSITRTRETAASTFADTLIRQGEYQRAAEQVYVDFADRNPESAEAPEALRDAIATYVTADSVARARNDEGASRQAKERAIELSNRMVTQYPNYRYRREYQALAANFLADLGRHEEAVAAFRKLVSDHPTWAGRADAMVRVAVTLDTLLNRKAEAAAAYAAFSEAFPRDPRAADAQFNAGVTYLQAGDTTSASRAFGRYAERFPRGERATDARSRRAALLYAAGDTSAARAEFGRMCAANAASTRELCADYRARQAAERALAGFRDAVELFEPYRRIEFVIRNKNQVASAAALRTVQAPKRTALQRLTTRLASVINTGAPEPLAGATFYLGLAQWEYGNYLRNIQLPATGFTDEERAAATSGAANLAEAEFARARETWQALLTKAEQEENLRNDPGAQRWLQLARDAVAGNVPSTPPPPADASEDSA